MILHLYDQDNRWCAGGEVIPGLSRGEALQRVAAFAATLPADPPDYHARGHLPGRCGKPARYAWADKAGIHDLPAAGLLARQAPVFLTDARDAHLTLPHPAAAAAKDKP